MSTTRTRSDRQPHDSIGLAIQGRLWEIPFGKTIFKGLRTAQPLPVGGLAPKIVARNTAGKHTTCQGMVIVAPPTPTEKSNPTLRPRSSSTTPFAFCRRVLCTPPATVTPPPRAE
jgi:hypothetical protein